MCFGSSPKAPKIEYEGPSKDDIRRQDEALAKYETQIQQQQAASAKALQDQIDAANKQTQKIQDQFDKELGAAQADTAAAEAAAKAAEEAAAAAGASYTPVGAYGVTTKQTEAPAAETTEKIGAKKKPKSTLKISPSATTQAGSGLNIGV